MSTHLPPRPCPILVLYQTAPPDSSCQSPAKIIVSALCQNPVLTLSGSAPGFSAFIHPAPPASLSPLAASTSGGSPHAAGLFVFPSSRSPHYAGFFIQFSGRSPHAAGFFIQIPIRSPHSAGFLIQIPGRSPHYAGFFIQFSSRSPHSVGFFIQITSHSPHPAGFLIRFSIK